MKQVALLGLPALAALALVRASTTRWHADLGVFVVYGVVVMLLGARSIAKTARALLTALQQRVPHLRWPVRLVLGALFIATLASVLGATISLEMIIDDNRQLVYLPEGMEVAPKGLDGVALLGWLVGVPSLAAMVLRFLPGSGGLPRWQRRKGPPEAPAPVVEEAPVAPWPASAAPFSIVHLTDLHLLADENSTSIEGRRNPAEHHRGMNEKVGRVLAQARDRLESCDAIVISGDVTDTGATAEWAHFHALLEQYPSLRRKGVLCPGNHDVNVVSNTSWFDAEPGPLRRERMLRMIMAMDAVQGDRATVIIDKERRGLRDYLEPLRRPLLDSVGGLRGNWHAPNVPFDDLGYFQTFSLQCLAAWTKSLSVVSNVRPCRMQSSASSASIVPSCTPARRQRLRRSAASMWRPRAAGHIRTAVRRGC